MAIFVDTNVLVYARDASEVEKQPQARAWIEHLWQARRGRLSTQVLQEYYVTVTQKLKPGLEREEARADIRAFRAWQPMEIGPDMIEGAWQAQDRYQLSFWDALIVGAALTSGCRYLLTEDLSDGQRFGTLQVVDPFRHAAGSLGS